MAEYPSGVTLPRVAAAGLLLLAGTANPTAAQTGRNVLLVVNEASEASVRIGDYYARWRELPARNVVRITTATTETIQRPAYDATIETPVAGWLSRHGLQDEVLYIVLTKGVPIRIAGTAGRDGTTASVDSELSLLYRRMVGAAAPALGRVDNPYFLGDRPVIEARPFTRHAHDIYLVTRLDGYTVDDAIALVDRGLAPARDGQVVLDQRATPSDPGGDRWLADAADRLEAGPGAGRALLESTRALAATSEPVAGYYSWGSNDPSNRLRATGLRFAPGALGGLFVSTDGRTFVEPPEDWRPGVSLRPSGLFGAGSQSMAADLIREGITGVSAHVAEPYLDATIRPQILFPAYVAGMNLAESYYLAMPFLSWQTIVLGDPLVAPHREAPLPESALWSGMDADTELPALFSRRQLDVWARGGLDEAAVKLALRAGVYRARDDVATTESLLVRAVEAEPRLTGALLQLAALAEARGDVDAAIARYRQVIGVDPDHAIALNNLAYALAVHRQALDEALRFAERAAGLSNLPEVQDTLGWIHHLLGDDRTAARHLETAVAAAPDDAEILLHAAIVHAALGQLPAARRELEAALKLDETLGARPDVAALRERIGG